MSTEESPLLGEQSLAGQIAQLSEDIYERFSPKQKRTILFIVSFAGLLPMFVGGCFVPSIPQISVDLDSEPAAVSLAVSLSVLASSFGVLFWSSQTSFYGRRAIYIWGMPWMSLGSFAVAAASNLPQLLFWRFVQTFGCSGGIAVGASVIGDIYRLEERGTAMGTFFGATLFGLAMAPLAGGAVAEYWSWRGFQAILGVWGLIQLFLLAIFLPETAHPGTRGIDKVEGQNGFRFKLVNPFGCLSLLRSPNFMAVALANTFALISDYVLLVPLAYTIGAKYGITSTGLIGACFLPNGLGNFAGAPLAGRLSDVVVRRAKEARKGVWVPEDRLRAVWLGALVVIPISVTLAGLTTTFVDGPVGLAINLVCLFANGLGVDLVLTPIGAYTVDIMPTRSAEMMAAMSAFRSLMLAPASALIIPSVQSIGVAATNTLSAVFVLFGYFLIWLTIRYGARMRAYVDIGYPRTVTN